MKKTIPILTTFALIAAALATTPCRAQKPGDKTVKDFDEDRVRDTVWFDRSRSVIVCRLSSHDFRPMESLPLEAPSAGYDIKIDNSYKGFKFSGTERRVNYIVNFEYDSGKMRLVSIQCDYREQGGVFGEAFGYRGIYGDSESYVGNWSRINDDYGPTPILTVGIPPMPFPALFLEDFDDGVYLDFGAKGLELYDAHKIKISPGVRPVILSDSLYLRVRRITPEEYDARKELAATNLQTKPLVEVTDIAEAKKILGDRLSLIEKLLIDEDRGIERSDIWNNYTFQAYYPEVDILCVVSESERDVIIDLNDPDNPWSGDGVPNSWAISPDGRWRICGYYPGGASDHGDYWIQQWDNDKQKYEFVGDLDLVGQYADGWFWVDNYTVLFNDYGEMTVIAE